jgi:hypothetical protein
MGSDKKGPPVKAGHVTPGKSKSLVGVRVKGLEPSRIAALVPKTSVYTNFTTPAGCAFTEGNPLKRGKGTIHYSNSQAV